MASSLPRKPCIGDPDLLTHLLGSLQVEFAQSWDDSEEKPKLSLDDAVNLMKDAFTSACEREITVGDTLEIYAITKSGTTMEEFELKKD